MKNASIFSQQSRCRTVPSPPHPFVCVLPHTTTGASGAAAGSVTKVLGGLCAKERCVCGCLRVVVLCTGRRVRRVSARCMYYWTAAAARRACWAFGHARMGRKTCPRAAGTPANRSCGCAGAFLCRKFYFRGTYRVCFFSSLACARDLLYVE